MEVSLDYRPLWRYRDREKDVPVWVRDANGRALPFQTIATEHDCFAGIPWRRRVLAPVSLPPLGWQVVTIGLEGKATPPSRPTGVWARGHARIANEQFAITALPGQTAVRFKREGRAWLGAGLQVRTYEDPWGSWGGMNEEEDSWSLKRERERWTISATRVLENGPERAALWVRFSGKKSRVDLTFCLSRAANQVEVRGRVFSDERSSRLKLIFPAAAMEAEFEVPGGVCRRLPCGEVPGGRWVRTGSGSGALGLASDAIYGFETTPTELRATIMRATRYASDRVRQPDDEPWIPATDAGELRFQLILTPDVRDLPRLAAQLEMPISVLAVPARPGKLARKGEFCGRLPTEIKLLSLAGSASNLELRLHNTSGRSREVTWRWQDSRLALGNMKGGEIAVWSLGRKGGRWVATRGENATSLP
jgi:alpha-mannosidase